MADSMTPLDAVVPRPTRSFATFPTPSELHGDEYRIGVIRYMRTELGVDVTRQAELVARLNTDPIGASADLLLGLVNQDAILRGQPLLWDREINSLTAAQLANYLPALMFALYGPAADALAEQAKAQLLSSGEERPTPVPQTPRRKRVNRKRTSRSTGRSSQTDSAMNTAGPPETSPT